MRKFFQAPNSRLFIVYAASSILLIGSAHADVLSALNVVRQHGCGSATSLSKLHLDPKLTQAAKQVALGLKPNDAVHAVGYPIVQLSSIHLEGFSNDQELEEILKQKNCGALADAGIHDVGYSQRGGEVWILLGEARSDPGNPATASRRALQLVNQARAKPRRCGAEVFAATTPLKLNVLLTQAAHVHADDMARYRYLEHEGRDGSTPATRVSQTGYKWKSVGENVAAGSGTADQVITDWLGSPHHCANIMSPKFTEMGIAFAINNADDYGVYWAQEFGAPKVNK